jgi:integrase
MARGLGRVYPRGGTFWMQYSVNGERYRQPTGKRTRNEAMVELAKAVLAAKQRTEVTHGPITTAVLCERMRLRYENKGQAMGPIVWNTHDWCKALGADRVLSDLRPEALHALLTIIVNHWRTTELTRRKQLARPATINRRLAFLRVGLRICGLALPDFEDFKSGEDNVRDFYCSPDEFGRFYAVAAAESADLADFFAWLYESGMRWGEATQLEASWVDRKRWLLVIPPSAEKARKGRTVPLEGTLRDLVRNRLAVRQLGCPYLFHRNGEAIPYLGRAWDRFAAAAGIPDLNPHDFRRAAVTNMVHAGMTHKEVMQITGHRTVATLLRYLQVVEGALREKLRALPRPAWVPAPTGTDT